MMPLSGKEMAMSPKGKRQIQAVDQKQDNSDSETQFAFDGDTSLRRGKMKQCRDNEAHGRQQ
jgi:hypothetical protein